MKSENSIVILSIFMVILLICISGLCTFNRKHDYEEITVEINYSEPMVALTFDDGPNEGYTSKVLDILYENQTYATFFINGENILGNEDLIYRMVGEGHELESHTFGHPDLTTLNQEEIKDAIEKNEIEISNILPGYTFHYVRPPYGHYDEDVLNAINLPIVLWDIDSGDWNEPYAKKIYTEVINNVNNGNIVIFHDDNPETIKALYKIIPALKKKGFQLVTVSQLTVTNYPNSIR